MTSENWISIWCFRWNIAANNRSDEADRMERNPRRCLQGYRRRIYWSHLKPRIDFVLERNLELKVCRQEFINEKERNRLLRFQSKEYAMSSTLYEQVDLMAKFSDIDAVEYILRFR